MYIHALYMYMYLHTLYTVCVYTSKALQMCPQVTVHCILKAIMDNKYMCVPHLVLLKPIGYIMQAYSFPFKVMF